GKGRQAQVRLGRRGDEPPGGLPLRVPRQARVRHRAHGHRGQGPALGAGDDQGRLRGHQGRRALAPQRPHPAVRRRRAREPRARAHPQAPGQALRDRALHGPGEGEGAHARPDPDLLQGPAGEGGDRPGPGQGPLRQARDDQAPGHRTPGAAGAARRSAL
ncbi:MAG: tmRNA-binding protein SmpB, partial [uncultured Solirubrobacteraceae bacterium]